MDAKEIGEAVRKALREEIQPFYVERESHYQDHQFVKELRVFLDGVCGTATKTIVGIAITAIVGLIVLGFIFWSKKHIGP